MSSYHKKVKRIFSIGIQYTYYRYDLVGGNKLLSEKKQQQKTLKISRGTKS